MRGCGCRPGASRTLSLASIARRRPCSFPNCHPKHWPRPSASGGDRSWQTCPDAQPALRALRERGLRLSVVSNFDQRLPKILEELGILELIDAVTIPATCRAQKPDRRIFEAALEDVGTTREEALYVGDDPHFDIGAARAAGLLALDVTTLPSLAALPPHVDTLDGVGGKRERFGG